MPRQPASFLDVNATLVNTAFNANMEKSAVPTPLKRARAESYDDESEGDFEPETLRIPRHGTGGEFSSYTIVILKFSYVVMRHIGSISLLLFPFLT